MADSTEAQGERRARVVEFRSRKDYERWLATWGDRVEVAATATSGRRYTVTYNGPDTTAKNGKRTRNRFVKLLQIGVAVVVGGFLMLAALGHLDPVVPIPCGDGAPRCLPPTALPSALPSIADAVVLRPDQFILPDEQFPLPGYAVTTDKAVGTVSWTRVWTRSGGTPFFWVEVDATVLEPSATSNDSIAKTTCNWTFTTTMLKAAEITAPVVGDGAKACAYDSVNGPASTMTYTTGTRNTLITVSANRLSASESATANFLSSLADYQLWIIDKVAPLSSVALRPTPTVQVPPVVVVTTAPGPTAAPPAPVSATSYLHYSCGTSNQCAMVMGGPYGVKGRFSTQAACVAVQTTWAQTNTMQVFSNGAGSWCSPNSTATAGP